MRIAGWKGKPALKENDLRAQCSQKSCQNDPEKGTKLGEICSVTHGIGRRS
jgi:hypothetical protein